MKVITVACPGIRKGGGGGGSKFEMLFFAYKFFRGGGPAQKIAEKMILPTPRPLAPPLDTRLSNHIVYFFTNKSIYY